MVNDITRLFGELLGSSELRKVDFKRDQYRFDNDILKSEFIKDILCMANAPGDDGCILLGVKAEKGKPRETIGVSQHHDGSDIEQMVNSIIDEPIQFDYHHVNYKGKECALLYIPKSKAKPHWPKKDYGVLRRHVIYTRRSSGNREASMQEIRAMFVETIRISDIAQRKAKSSPYVIDELANYSLDQRKQEMFKILKGIVLKLGLVKYSTLTADFFTRREQICSLIRFMGKQNKEYAVFVYPWTVKGDNIGWARTKILQMMGNRYGEKRQSSEVRARLAQSDLIHISYKSIYTSTLEKWPLFSSYFFGNQWNESWGKVIKWETHDSMRNIERRESVYEFFLANVSSKDELKSRLEHLLSWVNNSVT